MTSNAPTQPKIPRINLARSHATMLSLSVAIDWTETVRSVLEPILEDDQFVSFTKYSRVGITHLFIEQMVLYREDQGALIQFTYDAGSSIPQQSVPQSLKKTGELFSRVADLAPEAPYFCHAQFRFEDENSNGDVALRFPLPLRFGGVEDALVPRIDEIRGLRGVRFGVGQQPDYHFLLDRPENAAVNLVLDFSNQGIITAELPSQLLLEARNFAHSLGLQ